MQKQVRVLQRDTGFLQPRQDAVDQVARRGEGFAKGEAAKLFIKGRHIGEGAANVCGDTVSRGLVLRHGFEVGVRSKKAAKRRQRADVRKPSSCSQ